MIPTRVVLHVQDANDPNCINLFMQDLRILFPRTLRKPEFRKGSIIGEVCVDVYTALYGLERLISSDLKLPFVDQVVTWGEVHLKKSLGKLNPAQTLKFTSKNTATFVCQIVQKELKSLPPPPPKLSPAIEERFNDLTRLEDGWDGDDSVAPIPQLLALSRDVLLQLQPPIEPEVGAVPDGGVDLVWNDLGIFCTLGPDDDCYLTLSPPQPFSPKDVQNITFSTKELENPAVEIVVRLRTALKDSVKQRML